MDGPENISLLPVLSTARVIGYNSQLHSVYVQVPSLQAISVPAKVLMSGNADAARINQEPLPVIGTMGLIAMPYGDTRGAVWLGSFYNTPINSVNTSNPPTDEDGQMWYHTHASGGWSLLDYYGNYFAQIADGSRVLAASGVATPVTYRNNVDQNGNQLQVLYKQTDRNQMPPGPYWLSVTHPSSGSATISPSGMIFAQAGTPLLPSLAMNTSGIIDIWTNGPNAQNAAGPRIHMDSNNGDGGNILIQTNATNTAGGSGPTALMDAVTGNIVINGQNINNSPAGGGNILINGANGNSSVLLDPSGTITITSVAGNSTIIMDPAGNVTITTGSNQGSGNILIQNEGNGTSMMTSQVESALIAQAGLALVSGILTSIVATAGDIVLSSALHPSESLNTIVSIFNSHTHPDPQGGNTGTPTQQMP
jgi:hypothetical protein